MIWQTIKNPRNYNVALTYSIETTTVLMVFVCCNILLAFQMSDVRKYELTCELLSIQNLLSIHLYVVYIIMQNCTNINSLVT